MENKKIDLNNIKVAIFDFDDTLAIHKDKDYIKHRNESEDNSLNYFIKAYLNPNSFYETIEPCIVLDSLQNLIKFFELKGVKMYCLSGMKFSFHLKAKEYFIHKYYSEMIEIISTRSQEIKCDAVKIIQRINDCNLNEILFVDDMEENIIRFNNMGIHALLPKEIDQLICKKEKNQDIE